MPRGFTIQITYLITQAESLFMDVLSNHTCIGIINDKTMPHNIYIKYKIRIQCIGARAYTNSIWSCDMVSMWIFKIIPLSDVFIRIENPTHVWFDKTSMNSDYVWVIEYIIWIVKSRGIKEYYSKIP